MPNASTSADPADVPRKLRWCAPHCFFPRYSYLVVFLLGIVWLFYRVDENVCTSVRETTVSRAVHSARCAVLSDRGGSGNLYHWFVLNIGGLWRFQHGPIDVYSGNWLSSPSSYHVESEALFAPDLRFSSGAPCHCQRVFGAALFAPDRTEPQAHIFLRELFERALARMPGGAPAFNASEMVYITRTGRPYRTILNEDSFLADFAAMGIRCIKLEDLALVDKLRLFASARLIISPQSAGLTFLAAANRRALVVEIFQGIDEMNHYKYMAHDLRIPFRRFSGLEVIGPTDNIYNGSFNFIVDGRALVDFVKNALEETETS